MSGVPVFRQISPWVALPEYIYSANDPKITDEPGVWRSLPEDEAREARISRMEEALYHAHEFISSVTAWTGHEDEDREALAEIDDALTKGDA